MYELDRTTVHVMLIIMITTLSTKLLYISILVHGVLDMVRSTVHIRSNIFLPISFTNVAQGEEQLYPIPHLKLHDFKFHYFSISFYHINTVQFPEKIISY